MDSEAFTPRGTSQCYVWKQLFSSQVQLSLNSFPSYSPGLASGNCHCSCYLRGESPLFKGPKRGSFPIWCHEATLRLKASLSSTRFMQWRENGHSNLLCGSGSSCWYWVGWVGLGRWGWEISLVFPERRWVSFSESTFFPVFLWFLLVIVVVIVSCHWACRCVIYNGG